MYSLCDSRAIEYILEDFDYIILLCFAILTSRLQRRVSREIALCSQVLIKDLKNVYIIIDTYVKILHMFDSGVFFYLGHIVIFFVVLLYILI